MYSQTTMEHSVVDNGNNHHKNSSSHFTSWITILSRSATWNLPANRSEEQKCIFMASWTISDNYLKTAIRSIIIIAPKSSVKDITFCQLFVKSVASEKASILIICLPGQECCEVWKSTPNIACLCSY